MPRIARAASICSLPWKCKQTDSDSDSTSSSMGLRREGAFLELESDGREQLLCLHSYTPRLTLRAERTAHAVLEGMSRAHSF